MKIKTMKTVNMEMKNPNVNKIYLYSNLKHRSFFYDLSMTVINSYKS